jgi:hypothetical protein
MFVVGLLGTPNSPTAVITASLNGKSQSITLSLGAQLVSNVRCGADVLALQDSTTCTVSLSDAAPDGGLTVALSGDSTALSLPAVVDIPARASSASFAAATTRLPQTRTTTLTASLAGSAQQTTLAIEPAYRVHAGAGSYKDSLGRTWAADSNFSGGELCPATSTPVGNTDDPELYQSCRYGNFTYSFPLPDGVYTVTLKFAELADYTPGQRVFNALINGSPALLGYDIAAQTAGPFKAVDESFPVRVTGGQILIQFTSGWAGLPMVNGIEITPGVQRRRPTVRLHSGGSNYLDSAGHTWAADTAFTGGSSYHTDNSIANTDDRAIYQNWRYGDFSYTVPVPDGNYTLKLHFAEIQQAGPGQRMFDVLEDGKPLLNGFDISAQAGGAYTAVDQAFPVTVANGQIMIQFQTHPGSLPAAVNGIELTPAKRQTIAATAN